MMSQDSHDDKYSLFRKHNLIRKHKLIHKTQFDSITTLRV
jgi:hypothetical protein